MREEQLYLVYVLQTDKDGLWHFASRHRTLCAAQQACVALQVNYPKWVQVHVARLLCKGQPTGITWEEY